MKKTGIILIALAFTAGSYGQVSNYQSDKIAITNFLIEYCPFIDGNPIHQEQADEVNIFVRKVFEKQYTSDEIPDLTTQALQLFYDNTIGIFEDLTDVTRMTIRRSLCYMALAFLSDEYRYTVFLEDARQELNKLAPDLNGRDLLIVNMIELYKDLTHDNLSKETILRLQNDVKEKEKYISDKNVIEQYRKIVEDIEKKMNSKTIKKQ